MALKVKTVMELLEERLQPKYVGWQDQYKAILTALGIPLDAPAYDVLAVVDLLKVSNEEARELVGRWR